uniref:PIN domain-containing protein n=1 Tax=Acrobeloides nanus TaxID=290746 RepID=A0A914C4F3_9BILA
MSTEDIETHLDDSSKKKKRPDRPIYIPKIVKREEPRTSKPSSSTYTRTKPPSVPSPLVARRISNASNAPSSDGSEHSRDTNSTVKSREYDQKVDEELPRASFYRHNASPGGSESGNHRDLINARERTEQYRSFASRGNQRKPGGNYPNPNHRYSNQRRNYENRQQNYATYRQHDDRSGQLYERNRRNRNDSLMSEQPLPRPDSRNSPFDDTRSVCTDASFMDNGELANIELQSQMSVSSMNSLIKPVLSIDSLLSQDMPNFDWTEDVDREEEAMRASNLYLQQWANGSNASLQEPYRLDQPGPINPQESHESSQTPSTPRREPQTPQTPSTPIREPETPTTPRQDEEDEWRKRSPSPLGTSIWSRVSRVPPEDRQKEETPERSYDSRSKPPIPDTSRRNAEERVTQVQQSRGKWKKSEETHTESGPWQKPTSGRGREGPWQGSSSGREGSWQKSSDRGRYEKSTESRRDDYKGRQDRYNPQFMSSNEISPNKGQGSSFSNRGSSRFSSRGTMNNKKSTPARPRVDENGLIIPPYHILKKGERDDPVKKRKELEESKFLQAWKEFQESKRSSTQTSAEKTQSGENTPITQSKSLEIEKNRLAQKLDAMIRTQPSSSDAFNGKLESPKKSAAMLTKDESSRIKSLLKQLDQLCKELGPRSSDDFTKKLTTLSLEIGEFFRPIILRDLEYAHIAMLDHVLWKKNFYRTIETLRNATVGVSPNAKKIRENLAKFLEKLAEFYQSMLNDCETSLNISLEEILPFTGGFPEPSLNYCTEIGIKKGDGLSQPIMEAAQLIYLSMGDISRYRVIIAALDSYREALGFYAKAALLGPENGRAFSQIALIAVYSNKWLDLIYFYSRALSTVEPFESAKESLESAFSDMSKRCKNYEPVVSGIFDKLTESSSAAFRADRPHELWFLPDGTAKDVKMDEETCHGVEALADEPMDSIYKRMVVYFLHASGILVTKIATETFDSISERGLCHLNAILRRESSPLTALELLKFAAIFIFTVHNAVIRGARIGTQWTLHESFRLVITYYGTLLRELKENLEIIPDILNGETTNSKVLKVLPALHFISSWLSDDSVRNIYSNLSMNCHSSMLFTVDCWKLLAEISNELMSLQKRQILARLSEEKLNENYDLIRIVLPENVFVASFCDVFSIEPVEYFVRLDSTKSHLIDNNSSLLATHVRLGSLLSSAEKLSKLDVSSFKWNAEKQKYYRPREIQQDFAKEDSIEAHIATLNMEDENKPKTREEEELLKQQLLMEEEQSRIVLEVHPKYLVIDTNTYVDHLEGITRIFTCKEDFSIVVPTVVISELDFQSKNMNNLPQIAGLPLDKEDWLAQKANEALNFLKKHRDEKKFFTITVRGVAQPKLTFGQEDLAISKMSDSGAKGRTNDDYILAACENMIKKFSEKPVSKPSESNPNQKFIAKSVVLITDDRALTIKALAAKVPVSTLPSFIEWAGL